MPERLREQEREDERDGEDDQLDPSRDLDRRAGAGHSADRTVGPGERPSETLLRSVQMATTTPRSRHAARLRADRRRAQARARRFAVGAVIAVLAVVTLALTAFDNRAALRP